jgi:hypothetical protein
MEQNPWEADVTHKVKKRPVFHETEDSWPCSQEAVTGPCPSPVISSRHSRRYVSFAGTCWKKRFGEFHLRAHIEFGIVLCNLLNISGTSLTSLELMVVDSCVYSLAQLPWKASPEHKKSIGLPTKRSR